MSDHRTTLQILTDLIRIDSQNPPGNEQAMVAYIAAYCDSLGIPYQTFTYQPNRANIFISLGSGTKRPLTLLGHLDTVRADASAWTFDPFAAQIHNGHLYGRGALDMKYMIAAALTVLSHAKRKEPLLQGRMNLLFTADEETGSSQGIRAVLQEREVYEAIADSLVLNEGGGFAMHHGDRLTYLFETGQKSVARLRLTIPEIPGTNPYFPTLAHEAILVEAVKLLQALQLDTELPAAVVALRSLFSSPTDKLAAADRQLLETMSESMVTPTIICGGSRNKNLPKGVKATADFDCRLLPNITKTAFLCAVETALGDLPVTTELTSFSQGYEAEISSDLVALLHTSLKRHNASIEALIPFITPGSNDGKHLRPLGCDVIGFAPLASSQSFGAIMPLIHGVDERISLSSIAFCEDVLLDVCLQYLTGDISRE